MIEVWPTVIITVKKGHNIQALQAFDLMEQNFGNLEVTTAETPVFGENTVDFFTSHSILVQTAPVEPWCKSDRARLT